MNSKLEAATWALGECLMTGIEGKRLSPETRKLLEQGRAGGILLFTRNYESPTQIAALIDDLQLARARYLDGIAPPKTPLWVAVDYEGGKVQRFKEPFTKIPEAADLASKESPKYLFSVSEMMAKELRAVGINLNFAPVCDIHTHPENPVIGRRAFGTDEETVSKMTTAFIRGHLTHGVQACAKHFPGHGNTTVDSHFALPKVTETLAELQGRELRPFIKAFKSGCRFVMTAHILNPSVDPEFPATLSKIWLEKILRGELRYSGIIISDDLEMQAITDHYGETEAPRLALEAGCDILIYRTEAAMNRAYDSLRNDLESGKLSADRVLEAAKRSWDFKQEALKEDYRVRREELPHCIGTEENLKVLQGTT
jgi:beta-N-acetylhexosaminidase